MTLRVADAADADNFRDYRFTIADTNEAPVFDNPGTYNWSVPENSVAGTNVGAAVTASDVDAGDSLEYTLGGTDAASFAIGRSTGQITVGSTTTLDYETKASYSVTVTATDGGGLADSIDVTIDVIDVREAGSLGRIVITVGDSSTDYGYDSGVYGTLDSGDFPGDLFGDGNSRNVAEIYEDADGYWYFTYSGGAVNDWNDVQEHLDEILVEVEYRDGRDARSFVLGGYIDSRPGNRGLKLDPPLPSRDWEEPRRPRDRHNLPPPPVPGRSPPGPGTADRSNGRVHHPCGISVGHDARGEGWCSSRC